MGTFLRYSMTEWLTESDAHAIPFLNLQDVLDVDDAVRVTHSLLFSKKWTAKKAVREKGSLCQEWRPNSLLIFSCVYLSLGPKTGRASNSPWFFGQCDGGDSSIVLH